MPITRITIAVLAGLLIGAQFIRPTFKNPPHQQLLAGAALETETRAIFENACQDCHSDNTRWPWYARTIPAAWIIRADVERGRAFMNLSDWPRYSKSQKLGYLSAMAAAAKDRKMPPVTYTVLHPDARLSEHDRYTIAAWAGAEYRRVRSEQP